MGWKECLCIPSTILRSTHTWCNIEKVLYTIPQAGPSNSVGDVYAPAARLVKGKEHWLYFVHPEKPAAGAEVAVYFNNNVSDILRCLSEAP